MRVVVQRVEKARVETAGRVTGEMGRGLMVLLGVAPEDTAEDVEWLAGKLVGLRIFNDTDGVMNHSVADVSGGVLLVSQFTLHASTKKGNRPSYMGAARPEVAEPLYEAMKARLESLLGRPVPTGIFGADMQVHLVNDGPVTLVMDSRRRE
ncbi:MAG: D-aminoacyl-tRNA deacylase [Verrucomicrobiota bacterium]